MRRWWPTRFVMEVFDAFIEDGADALAGSLAFFTLFSFPPMLGLMVDVGGLFITPERVVEQIRTMVDSMSGPRVAEQVAQIVEASQGGSTETVIGRIGGLALVLFTATVVLAQAQRALDTVWGAEAEAGSRGFLVKRTISLAIILGFVFTLLASMGVGAALSAAGPMLPSFLPPEVSSTAVRWISEGVGFGLLVVMTTAMHRYLPEARVPWSDTLWGGAVTALLLEFGQVVISWIISTTKMGSVYGATQSLALLLFWVFYASAIFLWGAEFIKVLAQWRGHAVRPVKGARITRRIKGLVSKVRGDD